MMRIAFISYEYPSETVTGGIGTYTKQVASLIAASAVEVHVFAGSHIKERDSIEDGISIHRVLCTGPHDFQQTVTAVFEKIHTQEPFQLIESAEIHANALEIKNGFPYLPLLVRLHASNYLVENFKKEYMPLQHKLRYFFGALRRLRWDLGYWRKYNYRQDLDYIFVQQADYISAPTHQMKAWVVASWKMDPSRIKVLENPFLENESFKIAHTNNEEQVIIFYGRLNVLKGLITATKAMKNILKKNSGWKWIIVGDDGTAADGKTSMKQWMENQLKNVSGQVVFYGAVSYKQLPAMLKQASIVLVPSLFESYSYVTIEAMSAGKAVVGSGGTGIASLIENNVTGKLADPFKASEWEKAIQELIEDKSLRKSLGSAALEYVDGKKNINSKIVEYYKNLLAVLAKKNT